MLKPHHVTLLCGCLIFAASLEAQQVCPGLPYVADTPEDELMQAVNGAENPQEQVAALDKYAQAHSDAKFMPCVHEYYTIAYLKLNQLDQVIDHGEKGLAGSYQDTMLIMNTIKAYVASGKVSDKAFEIIDKASEAVKGETNPPKPPNVGDAEWQKNLQDLADAAKEELGYLEYAFLQQLLPRVPDGNKRAEFLDNFVKAFPESQTKDAAQINLNYYLAYKIANNPAKAAEWGEKAIASDPSSAVALNLVAYDYAIGRTNPDKAAQYASKALSLIPGTKKPDGVSDEQFKSNQNVQLGLAHLTLGYVAFQKAGKSRKVAPAIQEFKTAVDLLNSSPEYQAQTLYYLGSAYEFQYPPNHRGALDALAKASSLTSSWQGQAKDLLAKVRQAAGQ